MTTQHLSPLTMLLSRHTRRRQFITLLGGGVVLQRIGPVAAHTTAHSISRRKLEGGGRAVLRRLSIRHARTWIPGRSRLRVEGRRDSLPVGRPDWEADGDCARSCAGSSKMGILSDVTNPGTMLQRREVEAAAGKLGVSMAAVDVRTVDEIGAAIQTFVRERASIVVVWHLLCSSMRGG
jgi:hypothetical protein